MDTNTLITTLLLSTDSCCRKPRTGLSQGSQMELAPGMGEMRGRSLTCIYHLLKVYKVKTYNYPN